MSKKYGEFTAFEPIPSLQGVSAPSVSDRFDIAEVFHGTLPQVILLIIPSEGSAALTDQSITVSVGIEDISSRLVAWHAPAIAQIRTLPDSSQVVELIVQDIFASSSIYVALESTLTTGTVDFHVALTS